MRKWIALRRRLTSAAHPESVRATAGSVWAGVGACRANWPPYNIERLGEDQYRITMALAGFTPDEITLVQQENLLLVEARKHPEPEGVQILHRGIANRAFRQTFNLADYVRVNGANLENGLLVIDLVREVPEAMKPRRIAIGSTGERQTVEHNSQAQVEKAA